MISASAAATLAGVHSVTVYAWLKNGKVRGEREGRSVKVLKADVEREAQRLDRGQPEPELERAKAIVAGEEVVEQEEVEGEDAPEIDTPPPFRGSRRGTAAGFQGAYGS
jgi:excisionase family DNA binding protein